MVYPAPFHRLVLSGTLYNDTFSTTLAFVPLFSSSIPAVSTTLLGNVATAVQSWWSKPLATFPGNGLSINTHALLTSVKLNRIGEDGKYVDALTKESVLTPTGGGGAGNPPPQLSLVATLRCPDERGLAGRGRMFFPVSELCTTGLDTTGRVTTGNAGNYASGVRKLLADLNAAYALSSVDAVAGVASKTRTGRFQIVTKVGVGRVVDTMRSRRNKQLEDDEVVNMP